MNKDGEDFLKGDDSLDELLMERFALAEERIAEICTEKEIKEPFGEFFQKTAEFLGKTGKILKREQEELSLEKRKIRLCMKSFFRKTIRPPMEILLMQQKSWGNTDRASAFCMRS